MCEEFAITHVKIPPYHPQANGADWDRRLNRIIHGINCSKHAVTGISSLLVENGQSGENINDGIHRPSRNNMG